MLFPETGKRGVDGVREARRATVEGPSREVWGWSVVGGPPGKAEVSELVQPNLRTRRERGWSERRE